MSQSENGQQTIIAEGVKVEGDFISQGDIQVDGDVTGSIQTAAFLKVGERALIQADIKAEAATVAGKINGNVEVTGRLEITDTSEVRGDISAAVLSVAAGAKINGRITMGAVSSSKSKKEEAEEEVDVE